MTKAKSIQILDENGKKAEEHSLPENVFGGRVNKAVLHQAVVMYQASLRQGNASTKERGAVSGGGVKPFRQKGTGRARAGSNRSPLWKGGGVTFGPEPRDFGYTVPKKIRKGALKESLNAKFMDGQLVCVEDFKRKFTKTKEFAAILKTFKLEGKILALLDGSDESVKTVSRNIARFNIMRSADVTAYDILRNKNILLTKTSLKVLLDRISDEKTDAAKKN